MKISKLFKTKRYYSKSEMKKNKRMLRRIGRNLTAKTPFYDTAYSIGDSGL